MSPSKGRDTSALIVLTTLFFMWGLITSLNDILIPHLKKAFALSYTQAMLIQFCFFGAYFVISLPSGYLVKRLGYKRGIIAGLATAGVGCLLFYPAAAAHSYPLFLGAFFVLAAGIASMQVAANPYVVNLGEPHSASSRLALTQAFNSLGTTIGPFVGAILILSTTPAMEQTATRAADTTAVQGPYLGLAGALFVIAAGVALLRLPQVRAEIAETEASDDYGSVWQHRHLVLGAIAIFLYVGAEVAIGSFLVSFMSRPEIGHLSVEVAGRYLSLYWCGAMVGRFIGAAVLARVQPGRLLAFNALVAALLLATTMMFAGKVAMWSLLAVGLFNSIMFPTIFTLAITGLGKHTGAASGVLCMAIVGGAVVPVLQGMYADSMGVLYSFAIPLVCYLYIAHYGYRGHRLESAKVAVLPRPA